MSDSLRLCGLQHARLPCPHVNVASSLVKKKCTVLVSEGGHEGCGRADGISEINSTFLSQFYCKPKTALKKIKSFLKTGETYSYIQVNVDMYAVKKKNQTLELKLHDFNFRSGAG